MNRTDMRNKQETPLLVNSLSRWVCTRSTQLQRVGKAVPDDDLFRIAAVLLKALQICLDYSALLCGGNLEPHCSYCGQCDDCTATIALSMFKVRSCVCDVKQI